MNKITLCFVVALAFGTPSGAHARSTCTSPDMAVVLQKIDVRESELKRDVSLREQNLGRMDVKCKGDECKATLGQLIQTTAGKGITGAIGGAFFCHMSTICLSTMIGTVMWGPGPYIVSVLASMGLGATSNVTDVIKNFKPISADVELVKSADQSSALSIMTEPSSNVGSMQIRADDLSRELDAYFHNIDSSVADINEGFREELKRDFRERSNWIKTTNIKARRELTLMEVAKAEMDILGKVRGTIQRACSSETSGAPSTGDQRPATNQKSSH